MRAFLIRNFVLGTWIKFGGIKVHTLRAPRVLVPLFVAMALFVMGTTPMIYTLGVLDIIAVVIWLVIADFGFSFFPFSYFKLKPVKYDEFKSWEQKLDFLRAVKDLKVYNPERGEKVYGPLTERQMIEMKELVAIAEEKTKRKTYGLKNLLPLAASLLAIIIWYILV